MTLDADEYSKLSLDEQNEYDTKQRKQEHAEQAALPYRWSQKLDHVEVNVPVPSGTRARQVQVTFKSKALSVKVNETVFVEGALPKPVKVDECTWTIDGDILSVHLEKANQNEWWPHVVTHHPKIDTSKIAPEDSKLSDLDGETRAMVEKMMVCFSMKLTGQDGEPSKGVLELRHRSAHTKVGLSLIFASTPSQSP